MTSENVSAKETVEIGGIAETDGITVELISGPTEEYEYVFEITGISLNDINAALVLKQATLFDESGNINETTSLSIFDMLMVVSDEERNQKYFLGNKAIQRADIENITFVTGTSGSNDADVKSVWDVSQSRDESILAWTKQESAPYTVYIGSDSAILANVDSSYLFYAIGSGNLCTATEVITGLNLLYTSRVTNMSSMFYKCGYKAMTSLDLGDNFDTSNVTDMYMMFESCGYNAMTSLDLGDNFDTSNVTDMFMMFGSCGYNAMTSLDLGDKFDTTNVTSMKDMFSYCGYNAMTSLDLGDNFNTSNVTNMSWMFHRCGYNAMTSLDLGDNFDTSSAINMYAMFLDCRYNSLDLGPKFTNIPDRLLDEEGSQTIENRAYGYMFNNMGSVVIYAPESIYSSQKEFKLNSTSSIKISLANETINPKYKPEFTKVSSTIDTENGQITIIVRGKVDSTAYGNAAKGIVNSLTNGNDTNSLINIIIDGEPTEGIKKQITVTNISEEEVQYVITLSDFEEDTLRDGKRFMEWSGNIALQFAKGTIKDIYGNSNMSKIDYTLRTWTDVVIKDENTNKNTNGTMFADFIEPKIEKVSAVNGTDTQTIVFDVIDKYMVPIDTMSDSDKIQENEIIVLVDNEQANDIEKEILSITDITGSVNGVSKVIGHKYTVKLSNFKKQRTSAVYNKYTDWSGTVSIKIQQGATKDNSGNGNSEETVQGIFVDFIKPDITYKYSISSQEKPGDINYQNKTFKMIFEITDKYFDNSTLTNENLKDKLTILLDGVDITNNPDIDISLESITDVKGTFNKTVGTGIVKNGEYVIGKRYTLLFEGLEEAEILQGENYVNYSGIITVVIKSEVAKDSSNNKNNAETTTIISGIDNPGGTGTGVVVDVVDPIWIRTNSSVDPNAKKATITVKGTDKYLASSSLTKEDISVYVENVLSTTVQVESVIPVDGGQNEYTITLTNYSVTDGGLKIRIASETLFDESGNTNKSDKEIKLQSTLRVAGTWNDANGKYDYEKLDSSSFLGNTSIQRGNIENITFVSGIQNANSTKWDVSQEQDESIMAWYVTHEDDETVTDGCVKVYIGGTGLIYGNPDSSYLFSNIGYNEICQATEVITNIDLLITSAITNMSGMFKFTGYNAMTILDLGDNFDTSNVTNMEDMFLACGYNAMTNLDLRTNFDTSNVTNMSCMFYCCGHNSMTNLDLGNNFNTSNVTNMGAMFMHCGHNAMTRLYLGDKFYTNNVENMDGMFSGISGNAMTQLDLGPAFTKIANYVGEQINIFTFSEESYFTICKPQTNKLTIFAPESIYSSETKFKLSSTENTKVIEQIENVEIVPKYKPEWSITSSSINTSTGKLTINLEGKVNATNYPEDQTTVISKLTADDITVYINGDPVENITKTLSNVDATNGKSGTTVTHTLTLEQFDAKGRKPSEIYKEWSGNVAIKIGGRGQATETYTSNKLVDQYGNQSMSEKDSEGEWLDVKFENPATNNKNTSGKTFADFIKPEITYKYSETTVDKDQKILTVIFYVADKYFDASNSALSLSDLTLKVIDENRAVTELAATGSGNSLTGQMVDAYGNVTADATQQKGIKYTLVVKNLPRTTGKYGVAIPYNDYSGPLSITIPANKFADLSSNKNVSQTITIGVDETDGRPGTNEGGSSVIVDLVDPAWRTENIIITQPNEANGTPGIVSVDLIATDKYYASDVFGEAFGEEWEGITLDETTELVDGTKLLDKVEVWIDDSKITDADNITKTLTKKADKTYTLTLSNWTEATKQSGKEYLEYSGTTKIKIAADTITDQSENTSNEQEFTLGFVDFINPEIFYDYKVSDVADPKVTIQFSVTDKYKNKINFTDEQLIKEKLIIKIGEEGDKQPDWVRLLEGETTTETGPRATLSSTTLGNYGKKYTLVLENLEQSEIEEEENYLLYSGNITVEIPEGLVTDTAGGGTDLARVNEKTVLTVGIDDPVGTDTTAKLVDFVNPVWNRTTSVVNPTTGIVTITIQGTDKYLDVANSGLIASDITVLLNDEPTNKVKVTEIKPATRMPTDEAKSQYGIEYEITLTGYTPGEGSLKLKIREGNLVDTTGNTNAETPISLQSSLRLTSDETSLSSGFLGSDQAYAAGTHKIKIERQNIEQVEFVPGFDAANETKWDVSAEKDKSIYAWYVINPNGKIKVYIGGNGLIYANGNSSYLFANIGTSSGCTATDTIKNLDLLFTENTVDMSYMFYNCGTTAMTSLSLGENFETGNVTNMTSMFQGCGSTMMTTLYLGPAFTNIPTANTNFITNAGISGSCTVYVGEAIYKDASNLRLNATSNTTINYTSGTIKCEYRIDWELVSRELSTSSMTLVLKATEVNTKYATNLITTSNVKDYIHLYVDGDPATSVTMQITNTQNLMVDDDNKATEDVVEQRQVGVQYTIKLSGFEQSSKQAGKSFYEWAGNLKLKIDGRAIIDKYGNSYIDTEFKDSNTDKNNKGTEANSYKDATLFADFVAPKIEYNFISVEETVDKTDKIVTVAVDVYDKYLDTTKELQASDIQLIMDNVIIKNGAVIVQDGTTAILKAGTLVTLSDGTTNRITEDTIVTVPTGTVIILPDNTEHTITTGTALTTDGRSNVKVKNETTVTLGDGTTVTLSAGTKIKPMAGREIPAKEVKVTVTKAQTYTHNVNGSNRTVGYKYVITIEGLEQGVINNQDLVRNYSGYLSLAFDNGVITDLSGNKNTAKTITVGIDDDPDVATPNTTPVLIDFVEPVWKVEDGTDISSKKATFKLTATDKYFNSSTLTNSNITVYVNGSPITPSKITISAATPKTSVEFVDSTHNPTGLYGNEYTVVIESNSITASINQLKIDLPAGLITDKNQNGSKAQTLMPYNIMNSTASESGHAVFHGSDVLRTNIEQLVFLGNIPQEIKDNCNIGGTNTSAQNVKGYKSNLLEFTNKAGNTVKVMDISAQGDHSILLWFENENGNTNADGTTQVCEAIIASDYPIYANPDSSNAFAYVAYNNSNHSKENALVNIELLNMNNVTNMTRMFVGFGATRMKEFDLGDNFDTRKVTNMNTAFYIVGQSNMTRFDLGPKFNTSQVKDMTNMFYNTGTSKLADFYLGGHFDTSNVTNMHSMFEGFGKQALKTFDLSEYNFDTSNVTGTGMVEMFYNMGWNLTTFELGDKFTTKNITSMERMFCCFGNKLTEFDLTKYDFDTSNVTNMHRTFAGEQPEGTSTYYRSLQNVKTFNLGEQFDTSKVTSMAYTFYYSLENVETFELGPLFDTSAVTGSSTTTGMSNMFDNFATNTTMTSFDLRKYNFDTTKVGRMSYMFQNFAKDSTTLESMYLGNKFSPEKCEAVANMFYCVGRYSMKILDLGPAFNHIASVSGGVFESTGKNGECIIYAGEAIFDEIEGKVYDEYCKEEVVYGHTIRRNCHLGGSIFTYTRGEVRCRYYANISTLGVNVDEENNLFSVRLKGVGNEYADCTKSGLTEENAAEKVQVYIKDRVGAEPVHVSSAQILNGTSSLGEEEVTLEDGTVRMRPYIIQDVIISSLEEETATDIYLQYSGMGAIKVTRGTLMDQWGNGNINEVTIEDPDTSFVDRNTDGRLFMDLVGPVINYKYAWINDKMPSLAGGTTDTNGVDQTNKTLYLQVEAVDKYLCERNLTAADLANHFDASKITVVMDGVIISDGQITIQDGTVLNASEVTVSATSIELVDIANNYYDYRDETNDGVNNPANYGVAAKFTIKVEGLQQVASAYIRDYSGYVTLVLDNGTVKDLSGNTNRPKAITIGVDDINDADDRYNEEDTTKKPVDVVSPTWTVYDAADIVNGKMTVGIAATDKYFKNVLKTTTEIKNQVQVYVDGTLASATVSVTGGTNSDKLYMDEYKSDSIHNNEQDGFVGMKYTFTITSSAIKETSKQVRINFPAGMIEDKYGNISEAQQLIPYNTLKSVANEGMDNETEVTFFGAKVTRGTIQQIVFLDQIPKQITDNCNIGGTNTTAKNVVGYKSELLTFEDAAGRNVKVTDISDMGDHSILLWFEDSDANGQKEAIISSNSVIHGNRNSKNLFSYTTRNTDLMQGTTQPIINIELLNVNNVTNMERMFVYVGTKGMTKFDLGDNFDTSKATSMSTMFYLVGTSNMTEFDLGPKFDTSNVTSMASMFQSFGTNNLKEFDLTKYNFDTSNVKSMSNMFKSAFTSANLTKFNLGEQFNTSNVTTMEGMFSDCALNSKMTTFSLGNSFNTSKVTITKNMFLNFANNADNMTSFDLGDNFDTSKVENMEGMFQGCFSSADNLASFDLGDKFNTLKVWRYYLMFKDFAKNCKKLKTLDLGDEFYVTPYKTGNAIDYAYSMSQMFNGCGTQGLEIIDLGPNFVYIGQQGHSDVFTNAGKSGCKILVPELIYSDSTHVKLKYDLATTLAVSSGRQVVPIYRPKWKQTSATVSVANKTVTVKLQGYIETSIDVTMTSGGTYTANYAEYLQVYPETGVDASNKFMVNMAASIDGNRQLIDGTIDGDTDGDGIIETGENPAITRNVSSVTVIEDIDHDGNPDTANVPTKIEATIKLTGDIFKNWSGYLQVVPSKDSLEDSLDLLNVNGAVVEEIGNRYIEPVEDTRGTFVDFINPIATYEYSESDINHENRTLTVDFSLTDKYYLSSVLIDSADTNQIQVAIEGEENLTIDADLTKKLTKTGKWVMNTATGDVTLKALDYTLQSGETLYGEKFRLVVSDFEQIYVENGFEEPNSQLIADGFKYSGIVNIIIPEGTAQDTTGNTNVATTLTVGINETDGDDTTQEGGTEQIVDFVDPIWEVTNINLATGQITLMAKDKYYKTSTITKEKLHVIVNGSEPTEEEMEKSLSGPVEITPGHIYVLTIGISSDPNAPHIEPFIPIEEDGTVIPIVGETATYKSENGGEISLEVEANTIEDQYGNKNRTPQKFEIANVDSVSPEIYHVDTNQNSNDGTVEVIFNVTDKNYNSTDAITEDEIEIFLDGESDGNVIGKQITSTVAIKTQVDGGNKVVGHQYKLLLSGFATSDLCGTLDVKIKTDAAHDQKGNGLNPDTTTISDFIDFVNPAVAKTDSSITGQTETIKFTVTDKYIDTTDKVTADEIKVYVDGELVDVDFTDSSDTGLNGTLTETEVKETFRKTISGVLEETATEHVTGYEYTLVLSGFEQLEKIGERKYKDYSGTVSIEIDQDAVHDLSGKDNTTVLNHLKEDITLRTVKGDFVDFIKPEFLESSSTKGTNTETFEFTIIDKYISGTNLVTSDEIKVYIDDEEVTVDYTNSSDTGLNGTLTSEVISASFKKTVNGVLETEATSHTIGHKYTLVLSGFEQATKNANGYKDYSGTVSIKINGNAVSDESGVDNSPINYLNAMAPETPTAEPTIDVIGDFVDFVKPYIEYKYSGTTKDQNPSANPDIDYTNKTFKMVFDITDKYFASSILTSENIKDEIQIFLDGTDIAEQIDDGTITLTTTVEDVYASNEMNKTVDGIVKTLNPTNATDKENMKIGQRITLFFENLQRPKPKEDDYANYSGIISVVLPEETVVVDTTGNKSNATTISIISGVDIPTGGTIEDGIVVDVVDPVWEKEGNATANPVEGVASITIRGTDKYYASNTLASIVGTHETKEEVKAVEDKLFVQVYKTGADGNNVLVEDDISLVVGEEEELESGNGVRYSITVKDFDDDATLILLTLLPGTLYDESGNTNNSGVQEVGTTFVLLATLRMAGGVDATSGEFIYEDSATSGFLGSLEAKAAGILDTEIRRQDIEKVIFTNTYAGTTGKVWDVSTEVPEEYIPDEAIYAWYEDDNYNGLYEIYIWSGVVLYANPNSSYLFNYIGSNPNCEEEETIENIHLLNVINVTDMSYMFSNVGTEKMKTLNLGAKFDTSKVTNMNHMFQNCGYKSLESINFGDKFDTTKVTDMSNMFKGFGYKKLSSLTLTPSATATEEQKTTQFNTTEVTNMSSMFEDCGHDSMTEINFGDNFNTTKVTDMSNMFRGFGYKNMTSLSLTPSADATADQKANFFNTSSVTNMSSMFEGCGATAMTTLNLGSNFTTAKIETAEITRTTLNMNSMFKNCGTTALTTLDLGEQFYTDIVTDMTSMFEGTGKTAMTTLDLGPNFTQIASTSTDFAKDLGNANTVIFAPESIYNGMKSFKLSTDSATTIAIDETTQGEINPIYRPVWKKVSSTLTADDGGTMTIVIKGDANETFTNAGHTGTYLSDVTSIADSIMVYIDGESTIKDYDGDGTSEDTITKSIVIGEPVENVTTGKTEITATITLKGFTESLRQSGKNFKEWSGNVAVQLGKGTLVDTYGNKNLETIDVKHTTGTPQTTVIVNERVEIEDTETNKEASNTMFVDDIKPEFTYEYSDLDVTPITTNPGISYEDNKVTVVFDVTDKYFKQSALATDSTGTKITVIGDLNGNGTIDGDETSLDVTKTLTKVEDLYYTVNGNATHVVGHRYQLVIEGLETSNGVGYSGPMTLAFEADIIEDKTGNKNDAKSITFGIDEPENHPEHDDDNAVIVDVINPIWVGLRDVNSIDRTNNEVSIKILGIDKYYKENTLTTSNITVYVDLDGNGTIDEATEVFALDPINDMTLTAINSTELATLAAKEALNGYDDVKVGYTLTLKNFGDVSGKTMIKIADNTIEDESGNKNKDTEVIFAGNTTWTETGDNAATPKYPAFRQDIVDFIKPVIKYQYSSVVDAKNPDIDYGLKTVTIKFTAEDKYLLSGDFINADNTAKNITIKVDGDDVTSLVTTSISADSTDVTDGEIEYTLVISNLQQTPNNAFDFSGPMQLIFAENIIDDTSGNKNVQTTITIDTDNGDDSDDGIIIDTVDPIWRLEGAVRKSTNVAGQVTAEMDLVAIDKYFKQATLTGEQIQLIVDGVNITVDSDSDGVPDKAPGLSRVLSTGQYIKLDASGNIENATETDAQGIKYTLTLSGFEEADEIFFENRELYETSDGDEGRVYREISGIMTAIIPINTVEDDYGNKNSVPLEIPLSTDPIDTLKPEIIKVSSTIGTSTATIVFDVVDKYLESSSIGTTLADADTSNIHVFVDGEVADGVTKTITNIERLEAEVGANTNQLVGYRYTLQLSGFEQGTKNADNYKDYSGTVTIKIDANIAKDTTNNWNDESEEFNVEFVDFIKPEVNYAYSVDDIDSEHKKFTMVFDLVDKYFANSELTVDNLATYLTILIDGEDITTTANVRKTITSITDVTTAGTINKTVSGTVQSVANAVIGKRYTLVLENLEQNPNDAFNYSGVVSVAIAGNTVTDTSNNGNVAGTTTVPTFATGNLPSGGTPEDGTVDVVDPIWEKVNSSANAINQTATLTIEGTDKFYASSTLTDKIEVWVDGVDVTSSVTVQPGTAEDLEDVNGDKIGDKYTITVTGFAQNAHQVKIKILTGAITDKSGNSNKPKEFIVYNTLKLTNSEQNATSKFLGINGIEREDIEKVTFLTSTSTKGSTTYDVSARSDGSIIAWYETDADGAHTVYIASDNEMFANQNSSYLFSYIGSASTCLETEVISAANLNKLNKNSVTNMSYMFNNFGSAKMTGLNLGNFETTNVTNMSNMFNSCGQTAMTTLNLGTMFNTTNVTDMSGMFQSCGATAMTTLNLAATGVTFNTANVEYMNNMFNGQTAITTFNLGNNFNTVKVKNMSGMFENFGLSLSTLTLGSNFYTSEVTDMSNMFKGCGATAMTKLEIGTNFNTTKVQNMSGMFQDFAKNSTVMTSLDLGNSFYVTAATNMSNMFNGCGKSGMTVLDLGQHFTKIATTHDGFMTNCGTATIVIYAPESIYRSQTSFK